MKSYFRLLIGLTLSITYFQSAALTATDEEYSRGYILDNENRTVTFIFSQRYWKDGGTYVIVKGSFNNWGSQHMLQPDGAGNYVLTLPFSTVMIPGNSGRPEFQLFVNGIPLRPERSTKGVPDGYVFADGNKHFMIVRDEADLEQAKADNAKVSTLKTLADFDLTTREGREEISNFRNVPGTAILFRSFHPIKYTYLNYDTEFPRHVVLHRLCEEEGIMSDINLSGASSLAPATVTLCGEKFTEYIPEFYHDILLNKRVLNVGAEHGIIPPTSEDVYFQHWLNNGQIDVALSKKRICQMMQEIVRFVNSDESKGPYLIHCHVGQDRTGVMCALISGLCGSTWEEMAQDFEKTQRLGNRELKGRGLLKHSLESFLGIHIYESVTATDRAESPCDIEELADIAGSIRNVLIQGGYLTAAELDQFVGNLNPPVVHGDANGDNTISKEDVDIMAQAAVGISTPGMLKRNMDFDGDGAVTSTDVTRTVYILNHPAIP